MDPKAAAALQPFVSYLHNQREFADVSFSSFCFRRNHVLTLPSCYSICTVSVLNAIRCLSHSLSCHTSIRRLFPGESLSNKPHGGSRLISASRHTDIRLPLESQPRGCPDLVLSMDIYEGPVLHRTIPPIHRYRLSPPVYVFSFLPSGWELAHSY